MDSRQIHKTLFGRLPSFLLFILLALFARLFAGVTGDVYKFWITFAIQIGIAVSLVLISYEYQLIKKRTFLPAILFLIFTTSNPVLYDNLEGAISAFAMILCVGITFKNYHNPKSQTDSLNIALILTTGSVFCWQPLIFFIPLFWIGLWWFRAFNARSFFASLLGISTVCLFLFSWCLYIDDFNYFSDKILYMKEVFSVEWIVLQWYDWIVTAFFVVLSLLSAMNIFLSGFSEKVKTTLFFKFLYLLLVVLFAFTCFFDPIVNNIQDIVYFVIALISGFYFSMNDNNKRINFLLILTIVFMITSYILRLGYFP